MFSTELWKHFSKFFKLYEIDSRWKHESARKNKMYLKDKNMTMFIS